LPWSNGAHRATLTGHPPTGETGFHNAKLPKAAPPSPGTAQSARSAPTPCASTRTQNNCYATRSATHNAESVIARLLTPPYARARDGPRSLQL